MQFLQSNSKSGYSSDKCKQTANNSAYELEFFPVEILQLFVKAESVDKKGEKVVDTTLNFKFFSIHISTCMIYPAAAVNCSGLYKL